MNDPLCGTLACAERTAQWKHVTSHVALEQKLNNASAKGHGKPAKSKKGQGQDSVDKTPTDGLAVNAN